MRIDQSRYMSAKKKLLAAKVAFEKYQSTVRLWEAAASGMKVPEGHELAAVIIKDGKSEILLREVEHVTPSPSS